MVTQRTENQVCGCQCFFNSRDNTCDRIVLNYKGIPHKTEWVEFPDIASVAKHIGAPHTALRRSGEPLYTVPILRDPTTNWSIAGTLQIALSLERMYPDAPKLFPPDTEEVITEFDNKFTRMVGAALAPLLLSRIWAQLCEGSKDYFRTTRERMFGGPLEGFSAPGAATAARWAAVCKALEPFARDANARGASDTFLISERETYADIIAACWLGWARRIWGADTQEWAQLEIWHDGRWGRLVHAFEEWEYVDTPSVPDLAKCVPRSWLRHCAKVDPSSSFA
jgi:glutathione S-transferase